MLCRLRGRTVVLGVRQDTPAYVRRRHPGSAVMALLGSGLDAAYRGLARRWPTVVVGPDLARRYARAPRRHTLVVSLVREGDIVLGGAGRSYDGELTILSVGRLETEKNPLLLVDVVSQLARDDRRWRLRVCGDGPLADSLRERLTAAGRELARRSSLDGECRRLAAFLEAEVPRRPDRR